MRSSRQTISISGKNLQNPKQQQKTPKPQKTTKFSQIKKKETREYNAKSKYPTATNKLAETPDHFHPFLIPRFSDQSPLFSLFRNSTL